jgi:hypothetical protein
MSDYRDSTVFENRKPTGKRRLEINRHIYEDNNRIELEETLTTINILEENEIFKLASSRNLLNDVINGRNFLVYALIPSASAWNFNRRSLNFNGLINILTTTSPADDITYLTKGLQGFNSNRFY